MMTKYSLKESDVAIEAKISLWEREKNWGLFQMDQAIGEVVFYPVPYSASDIAMRTNQDLNFRDSKGTVANIKVTYDNPYVPTQ